MQQYELDTFGKSHDLMSNFWNSCFDDLMSTAQRRDKDRSDCKAKFQVSVNPIYSNTEEACWASNTRLVFNPHTEQTMSYCCLGILGLFIAHLKSQPNHTCFMTNELITWTVCVPLFTGAHY